MPSSVASHTVPPFYACYFLRSLASPATTYIGSTPAPPRRKRQHNGDLTQGAWKTARARPWEMECIVYGFSSKIAALQFEWAWSKPHLSRHLKFLPSELGVDNDNVEGTGVGQPLFPSTSLTPGQTKWGRPKRRRPRPPSSPNSRILVMRALLRSEPFSGWGLKLAFFTEWSWLAYQRLEAQYGPSIQVQALLPSPAATLDSNTPRHTWLSRSGKPLHSLYPTTVCDFTGVDGKRIPLVTISEKQQEDAGVASQPVKKRTTKSKTASSAPIIDPHDPEWPEQLPRSANLKGLDACIQDFEAFPVSPEPISSSDITKKAKRTSKPTDKAANEPQEDEEADDAAPEQDESVHAGPHRMRFSDDDAAELEWRRFERVMLLCNDSVSDFMARCVALHTASMDARTEAHASAQVPCRPCAACMGPVDLTRQLDFSLCPQPHPALRAEPRDQTATMSHDQDPGCTAVFHLSCLADSFLRQHQQTFSDAAPAQLASNPQLVLPTHGSCPAAPCSGQHQPGQMAFWADIVRGSYRRHERFQRLVQYLIRTGRTLDEERALKDAPKSPSKTRRKDPQQPKTASPTKPRAARSAKTNAPDPAGSPTKSRKVRKVSTKQSTQQSSVHETTPAGQNEVIDLT
ncbi:hypothetical protein BCV70DRAFT_32359 [Testicularia cyperi]|uniref:GIY-YIG domain-containing protein n=1 Tax=Testicularia cyperi TaxID=1882483 RepID=A0A317XJJ8_9BASI|nr:hypothetical protein BCV70DRAFT_32359 [Testicularia cyperi]